ncbi:MAG: tail fiber domain-containing protein, partial [Acidobacteriota bacterium]|nr:tail fiber domain-containing protein [Acidobacteriota bacterium]
PFTIEAGAPSHSLYVDDGGRLGFGTSTPVADLHVKSGNTPTLRLEQDGSSGFTAQTWDVAGNEANLFIRDATNGSTLPFRIRPGAPTSAIDVEGSTGDIGFGTSSPETALHVFSTAAENIGLRVENSAASWDARTNTGGDFQITLEGSGVAELLIRNTAAGDVEKYVFSDGAGGQLMEIEGDGDVNSKTGVFGMLSDRNAKTDISTVDTGKVLARVAEMPISTWRYKANSDELHMGPMAQDFYAAFGLHEDGQSIALNDLSGVALAAIKGLDEELESRSRMIEELMARVEALEAERATQ